MVDKEKWGNLSLKKLARNIPSLGQTFKTNNKPLHHNLGAGW